jgi:hypothetical protein
MCASQQDKDPLRVLLVRRVHVAIGMEDQAALAVRAVDLVRRSLRNGEAVGGEYEGKWENRQSALILILTITIRSRRPKLTQFL